MWKYTGIKRPTFAIEPLAGQESVWDYPRPPSLEHCSLLVRVTFEDQSLAETTHSFRLLETASPPTFYLPKKDIQMSQLVRVTGESFCEWKGMATYYALKEVRDMPVAWGYDNPNPPYQHLADYLSFYPGRIACFVDNERVRPQPGHFYGGWVTDAIVGPFKGEPGTGGW